VRGNDRSYLTKTYNMFSVYSGNESLAFSNDSQSEGYLYVELERLMQEKQKIIKCLTKSNQ
jgi:hypothetical protein